jgi:hypothetical protein
MAVQGLIRDQLVDVLMDKMRNDPYPSVDVMDSLEVLLDPLELDDYAQLLLERVRRDRYPSWPIIYRLHELAGRQLYAALGSRGR